MIIALTPNPCIDRVLHLDRKMTPHSLHRVTESFEYAGGKGVNLARVVRVLGGEVLLAGFLGGFNGLKFRHLMQQEGLDGVFLELQGETRECQILLDGSDQPTEVNEKGLTVGKADWQKLLTKLPAGKLAICGSLPPGDSLEHFGAILSSLPSKPVVDTSGKALDLALSAGVLLCKPNGHELAAIAGAPISTMTEAFEAASELYQTFNTPILLTLGAQGAALVTETVQHVQAPKVKVKNPIGAGDSLLGAYLWATEQGYAPEHALRWGVAAGAECARKGGTAFVTREGITELYQQTQNLQLS
ncbi:1-phosphofructokinase family hexose kinase [Deinococcus roseus]|uniref:1-phosphofructokinase n=1 Tax=Deinococcus roseus TaxID=392414 RepID=A0ABQ2CWX3_9DEIO|nr:1-phosphofructokinase family hexose kinase [Deinococcus roseus]GGJ28861.1 1-phosphofructokinase [Deinococcus roseus]